MEPRWREREGDGERRMSNVRVVPSLRSVLTLSKNEVTSNTFPDTIILFK